MRDSKTGDTEPHIWGKTPPEIGDVDGDKRWPKGCPEEHRDRFVLDNRVGT
jgi:hypothetical protein